MYLLALETATEYCSAAILHHDVDGAVTLCRAGRHAPRQQTELLLPMIDEVLATAGIGLSALAVLAYSAGPGAFTGVRIAAAVAQGLALAVDRPLLAVSSLQSLAQGLMHRQSVDKVLSCFDARMGEVYAGAYVRGASGRAEPLAPAVVAQPAALPPALVQAWRSAPGVGHGAGSGWASYAPVLAQACPVVQEWPDFAPDAEDVARLALPLWLAGEAKPPEQALPVYLRDDVWKKLPGR